ncbi:MAG: hypothetical protein ABIF71_09875 [Planctomycetota bacterium]
MRAIIYRYEVLRDDHVVEPFYNGNWQIVVSDFGVKAVTHWGDNDGHLAARSWDPPIRDLDADFGRLHPRTSTVDRPATREGMARLAALFDGVLGVRIRGGFYWTMGMTWHAIELIGLEGLMLSMYDNPAGLHRLMAFLRDDHLAFADWLEREGLYSLNNGNDYIGSGSMGYSAALPRSGRPADAPVVTADLWVLWESQETVGVGPEQVAEFVLPYQTAIAQRFGRVYYGCCEPVHNRRHLLRDLPRLAWVSVSPWADQRFMAEVLGRRFVFSRNPNPTQVSTERFDEAAIRADFRTTLAAARGCRLEIIMKDVHILHEQPERLARWVALARGSIIRATRPLSIGPGYTTVRPPIRARLTSSSIFPASRPATRSRRPSSGWPRASAARPRRSSCMPTA